MSASESGRENSWVQAIASCMIIADRKTTIYPRTAPTSIYLSLLCPGCRTVYCKNLDLLSSSSLVSRLSSLWVDGRESPRRSLLSCLVLPGCGLGFPAGRTPLKPPNLKPHLFSFSLLIEPPQTDTFRDISISLLLPSQFTAELPGHPLNSPENRILPQQWLVDT